MFFFFYLFTLLFSLHAKQIDDLKWVNQLNQDEQQLVVLMLRNKLDKHLNDVIIPNVKTGDDALWMHKIYATGLNQLSSACTKNVTLKNDLSNEVNLLLDRVHGDISQDEFMQKQPILFNKSTLFIKQVKIENVKKVFDKYHNKLDNSADALIIYSKLVATGSSVKANDLAKKIAKSIQSFIDDNNGKVKIANATYLDRVMSYQKDVILGYTINKEELISSIMNQYNFNYSEALSQIESKEFVNNLNLMYPQTLHNSYCNNPEIRQSLKDGINLNVNIFWDNRSPLMNNSIINEKSCKVSNL